MGKGRNELPCKSNSRINLCLRCSSEIMPMGVEMATHLEEVGQTEKQRSDFPFEGGLPRKVSKRQSKN